MAAFGDLVSPSFRAVAVKVCLITVAAIVGLGVLAAKLAFLLPGIPHWLWLTASIHVAATLLLLVGLPFLVAPISFAVATLFFDQLADDVERSCAPVRGRPVRLGEGLWVGAVFTVLSLAVNALALLLLLVPGLNAVAFFAANAFLLGRGFFELAVLRYASPAEMRALRSRHGFEISVAGGVCAAVAAVPILNLVTPLFATALMVRIAQPLIQQKRLYRAV